MDRLDLRLVEYFVAVAEELHFGRAARRLHIAQPSLSQQIRRLESLLGATLLERNSRHVALTDAGRALLREGQKTLRQAEHTIRATRAAGTERLTVGFYGSAAADLLPEVLRALTQRHPSLTVSVHELLLGSLDDIVSGTVDIAFTRLRPGQTELEIDVLVHEPRLVAVARTHRLAQRHGVRYADLAEETFIVNPAVPGAGPPAGWLAEQRRHGLPGQANIQTSSIQEILTLVGAERGVCLVPAAVARHYPRREVVYLPCHDAEPAVVSLARRPGPLRPVLKAFIETARRVVHTASLETDPAAVARWRKRPSPDRGRSEV